MNEYEERLRSRPYRPDLTYIKNRRLNVFESTLKKSQCKKSPLWTISDLENVLNTLKKNISRDNDGYLNELFRPECIGEDLKHSLLVLMNKLKVELFVPLLMLITNITTIPKSGCTSKLQNERGIFRTSVLRTVFMRLIYNQEYNTIDQNMSDCNIGGRKNKGCRNHIFVINGVIHDVMSSVQKKPIVIQIFDFSQMFDAIKLEEAICDMYNVGVQNDNLKLLYEANKTIHTAVKTPFGKTDRKVIKSSVLQGDTFGPSFASVQVDNICKEAVDKDMTYHYKNKLPIGPLGMIDDVITVTEAGYKAVELNSFINMKGAEKTLQFNSDKCKVMFVGKRKPSYTLGQLSVDK